MEVGRGPRLDLRVAWLVVEDWRGGHWWGGVAVLHRDVPHLIETWATQLAFRILLLWRGTFYICLDGEKRLHYICNKQYTSEYKSANSCKAFSSVYQGSKFSREIKYFPDQWTLRARGRTFSRNLSSEFKQRTLFSIHSCTIMEQCEEENSSAVYWEDIPKKW